MKHYNLVILFFLSTFLSGNVFYYKNNKKEFLTPIENYGVPFNRSNSQLKYYKTARGDTIALSNQIIVKLKKGVTLKPYLSAFGLKFIKEIGRDMYLVKTSKSSLTLDISNRLSEEKEILYSHPDFIQKRRLR